MYGNCQHFSHSVQKPMTDSKGVTGVATQTPFWLSTFNRYDFFTCHFGPGRKKYEFGSQFTPLKIFWIHPEKHVYN